MTTVWVDAASGASGDMLLGALLGAGVPVEVLQQAVDAVSPEPVTLRPESVRRHALAATRCHVEVADSGRTPTHRTWREVRELLARAELAEPVRDLATRAFTRLAEAEARVHGTAVDDVHFHEVGALDAIADVVGVAAGFVHLGADEVVVSPVAVGSGTVTTSHGELSVPPPAVAELLRGVPSWAGPASAPATELCTPTGAALLTTVATAYGPQPAMGVEQVGVGAGGRNPEGHANVLRLFVGTAAGASRAAAPLVIETNVDDLDPRLWPQVVARLLAAGASDAWLTPIVMKKGRPAHTLHVLTSPAHADAVRLTVFRETTAIGMREHEVGKHALDREMVAVEVDGQPIAVKLARHDGVVLNAMPEFDDVVRAADATGRPVKAVLADAVAASRKYVD
ncbi:nickel pincer cofactor biosynthesis protein LarC [Nocardioides aestuarii]|uniref:Pyridinium-3,5-bisthiocarboxylic acid mononucleotide nickel insertion protein n=1 Tax=Nocardioides aestuarii TaxID=252231 RepID=A0ABW4TL56_9ACTN